MASSFNPITAEFIILGARKIRYSRPFAVKHLETNRDLKMDFAYVARSILTFHFLQHRERDKIIGIRMHQGLHTHSSYFCYNEKLIVDSIEFERPRRERFPFALTARFAEKIAAHLRDEKLTKALFVYPWRMGNPQTNRLPRYVEFLRTNISAISPQTGYQFFPNKEPAPSSWLAHYRRLRDASHQPAG